MTGRYPTEKAKKLLEEHESEIIKQLGPKAFELLTPAETAQELGLKERKGKPATIHIPDLIRQGWLEPAPGKNIGSAYQYYRWRVEFVKQFKRTYKTSEGAPS